ncbi:MAG: Eco57I restriction-modification methylase domain-containing protein [Chloroflexi bacterium]|nr:Eco57I restriction-modification methylase domain-containing protein [Chloroflexota bacterium]
MFIERGLKLARQNQFLGMIIPNTWLSNLYSHQIREHIFNNVEVLTVVHYQQPVFPNVSVDTEIVIFSNRSPFSEHFIQICIIEKANCVEEYSIPQKKWQDKRGEPVNIFERPEYTAVTSKIISLPTLGELCVITQGAKPFQVGKGTPPQTRKIVNNKPYVSEIKQDKTFRPLLRGSLIERYQINWNQNYWISFGDWLAEPRYSANHDAPSKIVIRQTGDSLVAALDNEQLIVRDNLYTIVPKKQNIDLCYILALLNSSLLNWIYRKVINPEEGEAFAQVKRAHLTRLPIVNPTSLTVENDKFLTEFRSHFQISIQEDSLTLIIRFLEELQQAQQDNSLKIIQNSLAWVAQQMIALNKMSRQLVQRTDLFSIVDREINTVEFEEVFDLDRAISNIESVYHDIEGLQLNQELDGHWLLEIQVKLRNPESNWRDFQRDVEGNLIRQWLPAFRLGLDEKVGWFYHYVFANLDGFTATGNFPGGYTRTTYEKLMATKVPKHVPVDLTPLVEAEAELAETRRKIELTDKLIDQIAYKLYGLTDDEIAIVEGRV